MPRINARTFNNEEMIEIDTLPDTCPYCHYSLLPKHVYTATDNNGAFLSFFCTRNECNKYFIYEYGAYSPGNYYLIGPSGGKHKGAIHSNTIKNISSRFVDIYGQSEAAEHYGLKDICGVGYRKALEFLIKDYIIKNNPDLKETVEGKLLAACIGDHIDNKKIVDISKRAVWIGNDETHYVRKWEGMDITHLKQLIALTVHWIETEELTNQMISAMPDPRKK